MLGTWRCLAVSRTQASIFRSFVFVSLSSSGKNKDNDDDNNNGRWCAAAAVAATRCDRDCSPTEWTTLFIDTIIIIIKCNEWRTLARFGEYRAAWNVVSLRLSFGVRMWLASAKRRMRNWQILYSAHAQTKCLSLRYEKPAPHVTACTI